MGGSWDGYQLGYLLLTWDYCQLDRIYSHLKMCLWYYQQGMYLIRLTDMGTPTFLEMVQAFGQGNLE